MVRENHEQNTIRRFLLEQLSDSEREAFGLRLLNEDALSEEVEIAEDELIDDYLVGQLSTADHSRFLEVFLSTPERERKLHAGEAMKRHFENNSPPPPRLTLLGNLKKWFYSFSIPIAVPVAVAAMLIIGVVVWRAAFYQSDLDKGLAALNQAYRSQRPIEGRVSNLDYAPFITTRSNAPTPVNEAERRRAEFLLTEDLKQNPGPRIDHALGKLYLLSLDFPAAITYLEKAKQADPRNAQIYADLGAAYLEQGKLHLEAARSDEKSPDAGKGSDELARSVEYLQQAIELNPNLLEALYNQALVHEYQQLNERAKADWKLYLQKDPNSPWANEARTRLKDLEEKKSDSGKSREITAAFLDAFAAGDEDITWQTFGRRSGVRTNITKELTNSIVANDQNSSQSLKGLKYLGQLQLKETGDYYTADLASVYASITPQTRAFLSQARKQMVDGYALLYKSEMSNAMALFESARSLFDKTGNVPETLEAELGIVSAAALQPDLPKAQQILARIIPFSESRHYRRFLALCLTKRGQVESNRNNYSEAIDDSYRVLQIVHDLKDQDGILISLLQLGQYHLFINDNRSSLAYLEQALTLNKEVPASAGERWQIYITTSLNLCALKLYRAALDYQNEALQTLSSSAEAALPRSRNYQYIGLTYGYLKQFDRAFQNARLAYDQGKSIADRNGQNIMANASLKLGDLYRARGDPMSALAAYDESLRLYETLQFGHYSYSAHKGKFLAYLSLNNDALASVELPVVLKLFDQYRETILLERQKAFFFDREQDTYDLAIDFTYTRLNDPWRAFDYSETSRARNLRELMHHGAEVTKSYRGFDLKTAETDRSQNVEPLNATAIKDQLPAEVQLVQYAVLEKKLLIWFISRSKIFPTSVDVESSKLDESVTTTLKNITARDDNQARESLKKLYKLVVEPIRDQLEPNKVLCFIPDKSLHYLPFDALVSPESGHYLLEDFPIMVSPSATILIESSRQASAKTGSKDERLLAVGNPSFDRRANPNAAYLPSAEKEVEQIASAYPPGRRVLIGPQATRSVIMNEIARSDVAHFAAHFEIDPRSALSSKLLLGPEPGDQAHAQPSGLSAADIYQIKLPRTRLAVLSGCNTGIEQQFAGEGPIGFARSFLVAGVPVVVASLWPVDSNATADLMINFHRFRRTRSLATAESLRQAQLHVMADVYYRSPYYWAGFTMIGGYADF